MASLRDAVLKVETITSPPWCIVIRSEHRLTSENHEQILAAVGKGINHESHILVIDGGATVEVIR